MLRCIIQRQPVFRDQWGGRKYKGSMMIHAFRLMKTVCYIQCVSAHSTVKSNLGSRGFRRLDIHCTCCIEAIYPLWGGVCLFFVFWNKSPSLSASEENTAMLVLLQSQFCGGRHNFHTCYTSNQKHSFTAQASEVTSMCVTLTGWRLLTVSWWLHGGIGRAWCISRRRRAHSFSSVSLPSEAITETNNDREICVKTLPPFF